MKSIELNGVKYELIRNDKDCFNKDEVESLITEYFDSYDYICGDFAYDKIRLKGFKDSKSKGVTDINNINNLDNYVENYCSFGARIFLLKKIK